MYEYKDYFDPEYADVPYRAAAEETEDYLRLLDMMLEGYLEYKRLDSGEKLFSRGLVITESEMESYFSMPPYLRERDMCDPVLAHAVDEGFRYIEGRVARTAGIPEEEDLLTAEEDMPEELSDGDGVPEELSGGDGVPEELSGGNAGSEELSGEDGTDTENGGMAIDILWIDSLKRIFGLDRAGVMAVVLALASVLDRRYERIFGFLQDDISRTRPTVGLLNALMARVTPRESAGDMPSFMPDEDLFTSLFVNSEEDRGLDTVLALNPLMKKILTGQPLNDMQLPDPLAIYRENADIPLFFEEMGPELVYALSDPQHLFLYMENGDEDTILHILHLFALSQEMPLYVLDLKQLTRGSSRDISACLADLALRLRLGEGLLAVRYEAEKIPGAGEDREAAGRRWKLLERISRISGGACVVLFGEKEEPGELIVKSVPFLRIPAPDVNLRMKMWTWFLTEEEEADIAEDVVIEDLADCYDVSYSMIRNTCSHAKTAARVRRLPRVTREMILESLRQLNQVDFSGLANYVPAAYTWEDITITEDQRNVLKTACDRCRLRNRVGRGWGLIRKNSYGNGVSLLLYGPPGTGKTMAAQVVASELGMPLYRVDISQIFSKYIGETEKNLSMIFDAARGSNVILFFDEADALFSKRTEINNSNDKYANSETAYLLQKIEEYDGMSILATNLYTNFDTAFVRRITYAVRLDSPDEEARYILWSTMLPETARVEKDIPFRFLAKKFELSGSNIKAILFSAAYMAGAEGKDISMAHIVRAMEYEFRKLGRFIDREAFGPYAEYLSMPGKETGE